MRESNIITDARPRRRSLADLCRSIFRTLRALRTRCHAALSRRRRSYVRRPIMPNYLLDLQSKKVREVLSVGQSDSREGLNDRSASSFSSFEIAFARLR